MTPGFQNNGPQHLFDRRPWDPRVNWSEWDRNGTFDQFCKNLSESADFRYEAHEATRNLMKWLDSDLIPRLSKISCSRAEILQYWILILRTGSTTLKNRFLYVSKFFRFSEFFKIVPTKVSSRLGLLASWSRNHVIFIPDYLLTTWWILYESVGENLNELVQYYAWVSNFEVIIRVKIVKSGIMPSRFYFELQVKVLLCDYDIMLSVYPYVNQVDRWTLDEVI